MKLTTLTLTTTLGLASLVSGCCNSQRCSTYQDGFTIRGQTKKSGEITITIQDQTMPGPMGDYPTLKGSSPNEGTWIIAPSAVPVHHPFLSYGGQEFNDAYEACWTPQ